MYIHLGKPVARRASSNASFDPDISYTPIWPSLKSLNRVAAAAPSVDYFIFQSTNDRALKLFILFHLKLNDEGRAKGEISSVSPLHPVVPGIIHRTRGFSPDNI